MDEYTCLKKFTQKSHYDKHTNKKNPCMNNVDKIKGIIQHTINEAIVNEFNKILNNKLEGTNIEKIKIEFNNPNNIIKQSNIKEMADIKNDTVIQKKGLKRNTIDKYYTKNNIVEQCIEAIKKYINISKDDLIIEPSAGNG